MMELAKRVQLTMLFDQYQNLLTQAQRQALHLYLMEDLSIQEIATILATSRQACHDAIKKGQAKLEQIAIKIGETN